MLRCVLGGRVRKGEIQESDDETPTVPRGRRRPACPLGRKRTKGLAMRFVKRLMASSNSTSERKMRRVQFHNERYLDVRSAGESPTEEIAQNKPGVYNWNEERDGGSLEAKRQTK